MGLYQVDGKPLWRFLTIVCFDASIYKFGKGDEIMEFGEAVELLDLIFYFLGVTRK